MKKLLQIKNLSLTYQTKSDEIEAIKNLNFNVNEGEFVSIIGPSGCGKTTILSIISGLLKPTKGEVLINDKAPNPKESNIGYMLQKDHLFPWRTIEKNIYLGLEIKNKLTKENIEYANYLLKKYGLFDFKKNYPNEISGGMRQRTALIRTLAFKPDLILLDEPFSALDYQTRLSVCEDVYNIIKNEKKTTLLVTHDISEAISLSDKIIVLSKRPAYKKYEHTLQFEAKTPLERREDKSFSKWFESLWKELN